MLTWFGAGWRWSRGQCEVDGDEVEGVSHKYCSRCFCKERSGVALRCTLKQEVCVCDLTDKWDMHSTCAAQV
jgi:hypothetical protein